MKFFELPFQCVLRGDILLIGDGTNIGSCVTFCGSDEDGHDLFLPHDFFKKIPYISDDEFCEIREVFSNSIIANKMPMNGIYFFKQTTEIKSVFDGFLAREVAGYQGASSKCSCDKCEMPKDYFGLVETEVTLG